jgi:hypothetical protein
VLAFEQDSGIATDVLPGKQSLVDCEATIETLRRQINKLTSKVAMYERHYNVDVVDADRLASCQSIAQLKRELQSKCDGISRLKDAIIYKRNDTTMSTLLCERRRLQSALEVKNKRVNELEPIILQHDRDMYQRDVQIAKFDALKEYIHQMVEAGGLQMVVVVIFLGALAGNAGIDLAELGVDGTLFQTYLVYAVAIAEGLPCPLLPQGMSSQYILYFFQGPSLINVQVACAFMAFDTRCLVCASSATRLSRLVVVSSLPSRPSCPLLL